MRSGEKANAKAMSPMPDRIRHTLSSLRRPLHPTGMPVRLLTMCPSPADIFNFVDMDESKHDHNNVYCAHT